MTGRENEAGFPRLPRDGRRRKLRHEIPHDRQRN